MLGDSEEKSTGQPVLCFFRVFYIEISTKCSLLFLSYSREEGSLGLSGRRAIFGKSVFPDSFCKKALLTYE